MVRPLCLIFRLITAINVLLCLNFKGLLYTFFPSGLPMPDELEEPDVEVYVQRQNGLDGYIQQRQISSIEEEDDDQIYTEDTGILSSANLHSAMHLILICFTMIYGSYLHLNYQFYVNILHVIRSNCNGKSCNCCGHLLGKSFFFG